MDYDQFQPHLYPENKMGLKDVTRDSGKVLLSLKFSVTDRVDEVKGKKVLDLVGGVVNSDLELTIAELTQKREDDIHDCRGEGERLF